MNQLVDQLRKLAYFTCIFIFNCFPIKKNKIFLFSYYGTQYGGNPKYITEYILENVPKDIFDIVWAFVDPESKRHLTRFRMVKQFSLKYFYEICTSKIVITNFRTTEFFKKRKKQYYIQTWHGSLGPKKIEKDVENSLPKHYVKMAKRDSQKCDLLLSSSKFSTKMFRNCFWYSGEIFEFGSPRNDILFQNNEIDKKNIFSKLGISSNFKIALFAPTFRKNHNLEVYDLDYSNILLTLKRKMGGDWIFLVKLHPHLINLSNELVCNENVINVTSYEDIHELLCITEVLFSDYSSVSFDFLFTKRPCFLYLPDLEDYINNERNLNFSIEELPFISSTSNKEIINEIENYSSIDFQKKCELFLIKVGSNENGEACKMLVKKMEMVCYGKAQSINNSRIMSIDGR
jgi:CDP-glycerol glycerophosphotransferase